MRLNGMVVLALGGFLAAAPTGLAQNAPSQNLLLNQLNQPGGIAGGAAGSSVNRAAGGARATSRIGDATEAEAGAIAVTPLGDPNRPAGVATAVFGASLFTRDAAAVSDAPNPNYIINPGDRVSVLSRDGLSTLTVADAPTQTVLPLVRFAGTGDGARVDVSRSGRLAVFREPERLGLRVEDLVAGDEVFVELAAEAGDLDFLDETTLLLTLPSRRSLAVVSLEAALAGQPALSEVSVDGDVRPLVASLAPGKVALYSTSANRRVISVVDPSTGSALNATALRKTVWSLLPSQSGTRGIVLHDGDPTFAGNDLLATVERSAGYSVVDFERGYSHLNLAPVRPSAVVEAPDGSAAYLMIADKTLGIRRVDRVDYGSLTTQSFEFDGVPEAIGLMEETGQLYVSQTGAGGRITFVDLATGERHEISAYELNAYIE
jgi:hypothetical protein